VGDLRQRTLVGADLFGQAALGRVAAEECGCAPLGCELLQLIVADRAGVGQIEDPNFVLFTESPGALAGLSQQDNERCCRDHPSDPAPRLEPGEPGIIRIRQEAGRGRRRVLADQSAARRERVAALGHRQWRQCARTAPGSFASPGLALEARCWCWAGYAR